jgi:hypothetical protein
MVGSLIYLAIGTRPDLAFAVSLVSRFMASPRLNHLQLFKGILRYLKGTENFGITYSVSLMPTGVGIQLLVAQRLVTFFAIMRLREQNISTFATSLFRKISSPACLKYNTSGLI